MNTMKQIIEQFDRFGYYLDDKLERDIEENRKGEFCLAFKDEQGNALQGVQVKVRQIRHEFKFGASLFHLGEFGDERDALWQEKFKNLFNYGIVPLYWDTLEPEQGKMRFAKDCQPIHRRPPLDLILEFCQQNNIKTKGHCLVYNSFQPSWISDDNRELRIQVDERISAIAQRYGNFFDDADVINEMYTIYKNCYKENGYHGFCARNLQITDDRDHEKWAFDLCHKYFPHTKLFWNEGGVEIFKEYTGYRSVYYMLLERFLTQGGHLDGIGMQYHLYSEKERAFEERKLETNPLRLIDVFDCYGEFGLPIHMSEISIPSYSNEPEDEQLQAELAKRLYKLWFGRKSCEAIVWWNLADSTAYQTENQFFAGMIRNDCSEKPTYQALDQLINHEWHTELTAEATDGLLPFRGFYGDYEVEATYQGRRTVKTVRLYRDTTGYDNWRCDFRKTDVVL